MSQVIGNRTNGSMATMPFKHNASRGHSIGKMKFKVANWPEYEAGQWLEERPGARSRRGWRKLHLALDADSGDIIARVMTNQDAGDACQVEPPLDQIDRPIGQFTADGAYDGNPTYDAVTNHSPDAAVIIPPRANAV